MTAVAPHRLQAVVTLLCPEIAERVAAAPRVLDERRLWWELSCCLLSSQVPFSLAVATADAIQESGLLTSDRRLGLNLAHEMTRILDRPFRVENRERRYRFPRLRARQLAATQLAVERAAGSLERLVCSFDDAEKLRAWLVANAPGIGPKQASMFLRNSGISFELAVLDRHVLRYMRAVGILDAHVDSLLPLYEYCRVEEVLREHSKRIGYAVGLLDWAIWIVMREAGRVQLELRIK